MKEVIKDAELKNNLALMSDKKTNLGDSNNNASSPVVAVIRSRTVPTAVIAHYAAKIASLQENIKEVLVAEKLAKLDRLAEMEAVRAENIMKHSDEIMSRPAREWFSGSLEKQRIQEEKELVEEALKKKKQEKAQRN